MNRQRLINYCDNVMVFSLYALIFFTPISIALVEISFVFALFFFFVKRGIIFYFHLQNSSVENQAPAFLKRVKLFLKSFKPVGNYLNWPIASFILVGFFSIFISQYPLLSIKGFFFKLLEWTFLYFIFIECFSQKNRLRNFVFVFLVSATLIGLSGFLQQFTKVDFIRGVPFTQGRITACFNHANNFGAYLIVVSLISFAFAVFGGFDGIREKNTDNPQPRLLRFFCIGLFILLVTCLGLTYSRGAWLAFFLALVFLGLLKRKILPLCVLTIALFVIVFIPYLSQQRNVSFSSDSVIVQPGQNRDVESAGSDSASRRAGFLDVIRNFNASGRRVFWVDALRIIRESPFGIGLNTYSKVSYKYDTKWSGYPHNCFLQMTAEMGFLGLFAFIWILAVLFMNSIRNARLMDDKFLTTLLLGSLAGFFGFMVHSSIDTNFYSVQLGNYMWIIMGIAVATQRISFNEGS